MKKRLKQTVSMLLISIMLVSLFPGGAWAEEAIQGSTDKNWIQEFGSGLEANLGLQKTNPLPERVDHLDLEVLESQQAVTDGQSIQTTAVEGDYEYAVVEGSVTITKYKGAGGNVTIPATLEGLPVTRIGTFVFRHQNKLTSITIPDGVTTIGEGAFNNCSSLTDITIPNSVTTIGRMAFYSCSSLINVTIPEGVTAIEKSTFDGCQKLTTVNLPESLTTIGERAFYLNRSLTSIVIPVRVQSIGYRAFWSTNLTNVIIPANVSSIGENAFGACISLTSISVTGDNPNYSSNNGVLFNAKKTVLVQCPAGLSNIIIPESVTSIGDSAFDSCQRFTSISIPANVTSIGNVAFANCFNLTSITIPKSVQSIGVALGLHAFTDCFCMIIYGEEGSYSENYAKTFGIPFTPIRNLQVVAFNSELPSGQEVNTSIKLTANATGGKGYYRYKYIYQLGGTSTIIQDYTTANTATFTPSVAGDYQLTVEVKDSDGNTATKSIVMRIIDGTVAEPAFLSFIGRDPSGVYYQYRVEDFNNAYLAYQIKPELSGAQMYLQFLNSQCQIVALEDAVKGYLDYDSAANASLLAQMKEEPFDILTYFASDDAKLFKETVSNLKTVDRDGNVSESNQTR